MPAEGIDFSARKDLLSYEEIILLAKCFKDLGTNKLRITGGEPFSRKDFPKLLEELTSIFDNLYITTNAVLIEKHVDLMKNLGVKGLNISLDTLQREKFAFITRRDEFSKVIDNIDKCLAAQLPIKINCVVMKGINDDEITDFIKFGKEKGIEIRFIEAMPFNESDGNYDQFLSIENIEAYIAKKYNFEKLTSDKPSAAIRYKIDNFPFAIIPAYSRLMCGTCNRIRLTPKGDFLTCLYAEKGISLRDIIRNTKDENQLIKAIKEAVFNKKESGHEEEKARDEKVFRSMTTIGG